VAKIVLPGDMISDKPLSIQNTIIEGGKTYATVMGLVDEAKGSFIPFESVWHPKMDDQVVGVVETERNGVSIVDLNSPFKGLLILKHSTLELRVGDIIEAIVMAVKRESERVMIMLARPKRLYGGRLLFVNVAKVPRIIGRESTMITQLIRGTKSNIQVGMNGVIWLKDGNVELAVTAINKIQEEAHTSGLTEQIAKLLGAK